MEIPPLEMTPVKMSAQTPSGEMEQIEKPVQSFTEMLTDALKKTNELQLESDKLNMALAAGRVEDISQVVVASQKAEIAIKKPRSLCISRNYAYASLIFLDGKF